MVYSGKSIKQDLFLQSRVQYIIHILKIYFKVDPHFRGKSALRQKQSNFLPTSTNIEIGYCERKYLKYH